MRSLCNLAELLATWPTRYLSLSFRLRFHLRGAVAAGRSGFLGFGVFMLCVSTMAVRRRCGGGCPRRIRRMGPGAIFPFALRSGGGLETIGINSLEVLKPLY